jgi:hypothetical protein
MKMRLASLIVSLAAMAATASPALAEWRGAYFVTTATSACSSIKVAAGSTGTLRYRVPGVLNNGTTTRMGFFTTSGAHGYQFEGAIAPGGAAVVVLGGGVSTGPYAILGAKLSIQSRSPATLATSTEFVTLKATVENMQGVAGCNVSFRASLTRAS